MNGFINKAKSIITPNQYAQELNDREDKIKQEEKTQHCEKVYVYIDDAMKVELEKRKAQDEYKTYKEEDLITALKADKKYFETSCISKKSQQVYEKEGFHDIAQWIQIAVHNGLLKKNNDQIIEKRNKAIKQINALGNSSDGNSSDGNSSESKNQNSVPAHWGGAKKISTRKKYNSTRGKKNKSKRIRKKPTRKESKRHKKVN